MIQKAVSQALTAFFYV